MSMITDRNGRHEVLLLINHNYSKIREKPRQIKICWRFIKIFYHCDKSDFKTDFSRNIKQISIVTRRQIGAHACASRKLCYRTVSDSYRTVSCARSNSAKNRVCQEPIRFQNFVQVLIKLANLHFCWITVDFSDRHNAAGGTEAYYRS